VSRGVRAGNYSVETYAATMAGQFSAASSSVVVDCRPAAACVTSGDGHRSDHRVPLDGLPNGSRVGSDPLTIRRPVILIAVPVLASLVASLNWAQQANQVDVDFLGSRTRAA
jgi:hypothetical protein